MASSASAAALLAMPVPSSSSSSDESDDAKPLPPSPPPAPQAVSPPSEHQRLNLERDGNMAMKALALAGDVDEVVDLFTELRRRFAGAGAGLSPNVLCYNTFLNALAEAGRVEDVGLAFDEMLAAGVAPNVSTLNILVKMQARRTSSLEPAFELIDKMKGHRVEPDVGTYSTIITEQCRAGRLDVARGLLEWMVEVGYCPMVHTYTPIVQGYCRQGQILEAVDLMAEMERDGCPPNVVTYNVLIRALCDHGKFDVVEQVLVESRTKDWKPSAVTYNTYMDGLCKKGMVKEALKQLDAMRSEGLDPTTFTLSVILNCLCHNSMISEAVSYLEGSTASDLCADVVAYNTVMSRLCDVGRWSSVLKLMTDMIKKGIDPNTRTFNILIHSLCIGGKSSIAKNLVYSQGFAANVVTYNTLIHWFYYNGKSNEAYDLFLDMSLKISPDEVTYTIVVDGLCREGKFDKATEYFEQSYERGLWRDTLSVLINRLVRSEKINKVREITDRWSALFWVPLCRGRPCSSYRMSPLNRGSSHRVPISILRCHTGVLLGVIGVLHPSMTLLWVVVPWDTGSTATLLVLPHGNWGLGKQSLLPNTSL
ncbi:hypothetical protein EJB05_24007, partial [Eragrostis curvula]